MARTVNITPLKKLWLSSLKPNSALRAVIASEPDELPYEQWVIKIPMFQKMLRHELASGMVV